MFDALTSAVSSAFNRRGSSLSVPILDGALKPNNLLEEAPVLVERKGLEDIAVSANGEIYVACGHDVMRLAPGGELRPIARHERDITALTILPDGVLAVGLGTSVIVGSPDGSSANKPVVVNHVD